MVVICPNCGREIFSDPDSCVMCGWRRDAPQPRETGRQRGADRRRAPQTQRAPPPRYPREGYERRNRETTRREPDYRAPQSRDYMERRRAQYRDEEDRYYQRMPREEYRDRRYPEGDREERGASYPQRRDQRPYYEERREAQDRGRSRERPGPRYGYEVRGPPQEMRGRGYEERKRNYCPNCGREILTDPDNCVICGWTRTQEGRRPSGVDNLRRTYPREGTRGYQERSYPMERSRGYRRRTSQEMMDQEYRRESMQRYPPDGWERHVEQKMRMRGQPQREDRRTWYRPEPEVRAPKKEGARDRFICENCGNPSLQYFADGLGRCPACGYRFRFSARPTTIRSKQKHKQFICSNCDNKNLQFFLDGRGLCPNCKREFRWRK